MATVKAPLDAYLGIARTIVEQAKTDRVAAVARLDEFARYFETLETSLGAATDALQAAVTADQESAAARNGVLRTLAIGSAALGILLAAGLYVVSRISGAAPDRDDRGAARPLQG